MKFFILKKKTLFIILASILIISILISYTSIHTNSIPKAEYTIVIDAGHGGRDGGTVGKTTNITESELNLQYALCLKELCAQFGIKVILTRKDMNGLYDENAENKKKSEMEKRIKIINESDADLMISIHMNSFPLSSCSGAQVFYAKGSEIGQNLAKSVQNSICQSFDNARDFVTVGDYFVLNYSNIPSVLVECGFLSNPQEEINLQDNDYRNLFCYSVLVGILEFFKM